MIKLGVSKRKLRLIIITILVIALTALLIIFLRGQKHFYRRSIKEIEIVIRSLGIFSPVAVVILITLSTVIPPLPIPIPFIEIASGIVFGFISGFFLNWASLIISSCIAYFSARHLGKKILKRFSKYKFLDFYMNYLKKSGAKAVLITRAALISPFNIVSYLAGLIEIKLSSFVAATIFGTIPEAALYAFIGSVVRKTRFSLAYVFVLVVILGAFGLIATYVMMEIANWREEKSRNIDK